MAQHDYVISNGTGAAVRSDLNNALLAIVSQNSGATEPTTTYAYQWWADTTTGLLKIRNSANNAWITLRELDGTLTIEDGTVSAPGLAFRDDLNTGIWRPGTDQFAISTNGVERVEWGTSEVVFNDGGTNYDFRVEGDTNANLLFVDASADAVGIGTSSPSFKLQVTDSATSYTNFAIQNTSTGGRTWRLVSGGSASIGAGYFGILDDDASAFRMAIDTSGRVGIGSTTVNAKLQVTESASSALISADADGIFVENNGNTGITLGSSTTGNGTIRFADSGSANAGLILYNHANNFLQLDTNDGERLRIDSSGRLLVGTSTSPSAGNAQYSKLVVQGNTYAATDYGILNLQRGLPASGGITGTVGGIHFSDNTGNEFGLIQCVADGTTSAGDYPGRLSFSTTADGASSPTERMRISSDGFLKASNTGTYRTNGALHEFRQTLDDVGLRVETTNTGYTTQILQLRAARNTSNGSFTAIRYYNDGAAEYRFAVYDSGAIASLGSYNGTTASAANLFVNSSGDFLRSTSSRIYKTDIEPIDQSRSDAILGLQPVWYRSVVKADNHEWSWYGLIAEDVAEVEPRLVHWGYREDDYEIVETETVNDEGEAVVERNKQLKETAELHPEGVQYDRLTVLLLDVVKRQQQTIEALEARVAALESA